MLPGRMTPEKPSFRASSSLVKRPVCEPHTVVKASSCSLVGFLTTGPTSYPGSTSSKYTWLIGSGPFAR